MGLNHKDLVRSKYTSPASLFTQEKYKLNPVGENISILVILEEGFAWFVETKVCTCPKGEEEGAHHHYLAPKGGSIEFRVSEAESILNSLLEELDG